MPQPKKAGRFGGTAAHHKVIMSNLTTELFRHGRIRTTHAKAKRVQPLAERMVTFAKRGDLAARREVLKVVRDKDVVHKLFADVGPTFADRYGGYTRVLKLDPRKGDHAPMALIELVEGVGEAVGEHALGEAPKRRWSLRRSRGTQSAAARERAEERAAAVDRGEDLEEDLAAPEAADDEDVEQPVTEADELGPQVDPAEVEARFAAEEDAAEATTADDAEADGDDEGEDEAQT